ncbi:zinc-binding dehydrogenase [Saccharopolyspora griseoalba]|uniref:Zinc-binding dehydrogenase n=1 Tax=Saccharopolyspora griseoalba TaxID=1431848 RepID=A0ABW2LEX0_9PSEU
MRAVQVEKFGGPEVLSVVETDDPEPSPGQVVVRTSAVDVLFLDTQLRSGWGRDYFEMEPPYVPGDGVAGDVVGLGSRVDPGWLGKTVVASTGNAGTCAELVAVDETELVEVPEGLDASAAVVLLHDASTALLFAEHARIQAGERVLVTAAAGGAGSILVQLARSAGAQVVGAARGAAKLDLVRKLGAEPVDYGEPDWPEQVRERTGGIDVVFDGAGGTIGATAFGTTVNGARVYSYGASSGDFAEIDQAKARDKDVTVIGLLDIQYSSRAQRKSLLERALREAAAGRVQPTIGASYPLGAVADAHADIEARSVLGRAVLLPG